MEDQFENHAVVQPHVVTHISDNYMPPGEVEGKKKEVNGICIKADEHNKAIEAQASKLGVIRSELDLVKKKQKSDVFRSRSISRKSDSGGKKWWLAFWLAKWDQGPYVRLQG